MKIRTFLERVVKDVLAEGAGQDSVYMALLRDVVCIVLFTALLLFFYGGRVEVTWSNYPGKMAALGLSFLIVIFIRSTVRVLFFNKSESK